MIKPAQALMAAALLVAHPNSVLAQTTADRDLAASLELDGSLETDRFAVFWSTDEGTADQARDFLRIAGGYYEGVASLVGPSRTPDRRIVVLLGGPGQAPDGTWRFPHVDRQGRVFLYRYTPEFSDYPVEAAHELVHAFRRAAGFWFGGFWEEGFAEAIAMQVDPGDVGFPRYGYPIVVTAGHLLAWDEYIPLRQVRTRHRDLGRRCQLQSYLERASFFDYLVGLEGVETLIEIVYGARAPTDEDLTREYGMSFDELVADWETKLAADYAAWPDADSLARAYRAEPPIRSRPFCMPSGDNR